MPKVTSTTKSRPKAKAAPKAVGAAPAAAPKLVDTTPSEAQRIQHRKDRIAALIARHRQADARIAAQKAVVQEQQRLVDIEKDKLTEINTERLQIRTAIHKAYPLGYRMDDFDANYDDMVGKTPRSEVAEHIAYSEEMREIMALPTYYQQQLDITQPAPQHVAVLNTWRARGYQDGYDGPCDPQSAGCPPEAFQEYIAGWNDAQASIGRGLADIKNDEAPVLPLLPEGEGAARPDWSMWDASHHHWTDEQKASFQVWYEALGTGLEPEVTNKAVLARIDFLDHQREAAAPDANALAGNDPDTGQPRPADDFEASPEELEAQTQRRVIQEQKAAAAGDGSLLN